MIGTRDIIVICPRLEYKDKAHQDTIKLFKQRGILARCSRTEIVSINYSRVIFVPDRPDSLRGRSNYVAMSLNEYEKWVQSEIDRDNGILHESHTDIISEA